MRKQVQFKYTYSTWHCIKPVIRFYLYRFVVFLRLRVSLITFILRKTFRNISLNHGVGFNHLVFQRTQRFSHRRLFRKSRHHVFIFSSSVSQYFDIALVYSLTISFGHSFQVKAFSGLCVI